MCSSPTPKSSKSEPVTYTPSFLPTLLAHCTFYFGSLPLTMSSAVL